MSEGSSIEAFTAFQALIKTLCLSEFPCGIGSWRDAKDKLADGKFSTTMKDYGVQNEKMEVLHEFLSSGTWDVDTSWSKEAADLRRIAVSEPWKISNKFIWQHFKTLRLIDKEIEKVDEGLKNLENLEELTLSVNQLNEISSANLPPQVKVLELCYNNFESIASICKQPPALLHLGLSYNSLSNPQEYKYFTKEFWPALMSLDLGYNNLIELVELVENLSTIPHLQNLVLLGNPLSLIPGYRGHVIDAMRNLLILDDVFVSADEKHHFKGLGKKKELILDEAQLEIKIGNLKGVPMPEEMKEDEERPEFPVITKLYHVKYKMLQDEETKEETSDNQGTQRGTSISWHPDTEILEDEELELPMDNVVNQSDGDMTVFKTQSREWNEEAMQLDYSQLHITDELVRLRDYLKAGIKFTIIEEKILQWPATPVEDENSSQPTPDLKKGKKESGKESPAKKGKEAAKGKDKGGKGSAKDKGKKKGKDSIPEMRSDPPILTEVGSCHISLAGFIGGESNYHENCHCGGGPMIELTIDESATPALEKQETKATPGKANRKKSASPDRGKSRKGSGKKASRGDTSDKKGSKGEEKRELASPDEDDMPKVPPPITLLIDISLQRWKTAADSMK